MKSAVPHLGNTFKSLSGPLAILGLAILGMAILGPAAPQARAQAPYLLPYTVQSLAGGGTAPAIGATCVGANGVVGTAYDTFGDGCPITSGSVIVGPNNNIHDVVVDPQGNIFFIDDTGSNGTVRRIDARSGVVTMYAGSLTVQTPECTTTSVYTKYGDGCPANDGKANVAGGYTGNFAIFRGLGVATNGDLYIADYGASVLHKISRATGIMTIAAGALASGTKATSIGGSKGYGADGVIAFGQPVAPSLTPSSQSALNSDRGVFIDASGNIYIADSGNNTIRKVTAATGVISTIVGANPNNSSAATAGFGGDGGPAASSSTLLSVPEDVEVDSFGNIFIADMSNARIRVVYAGGAQVANLILKTYGSNPTVGDIYTIVGNGVAATGYVPPSTPTLATSVSIGAPRKFRLDSHGNLFIADNGNNVIWFVDASTGYMRVIAGTLGATTPPSLCAAHTDAFGDNCPATTAAFNPNAAMGVTVDAFDNLYVTDPLDSRLRKVNTNQVFPATPANSTTTQTVEIHFAAGDGPATTTPYSVTPGSDFALTTAANCTTNSDTTQDCLLNVSFTPTVPGEDTAILTITSKSNGAISFPLSGTAVESAVALDPGSVSPITATALNAPFGVAVDLRNSTYLADTGNNRVVAYSAGGTQTLIAGAGAASYTGDNGSGAAATLNAPKAVAVAPSGLIYIADTGNNVIRRVNPATGIITTIAGGATAVCPLATDAFGDGCPATQAIFSAPAGLATDSDGNVFVSDSGHNLIREITASGYAFLAGGGAATVCGAGDTYGNGCLASQATFKNPTALQLDLARNLFIADTGDNYIRKIASATNLVSAVAGNGQPGSSGNNGLATSAQLNAPTGLAVDAAANLYIADTGNSAVRLVNAQGNISTVVGILGVPGTGTVPGSAFSAQLSSPAGVASNGAGALVVLDSGNNRLLADNRDLVSYYFGRTNPASSSPVLSILESSTGNAAATLSTSAPLFTPSGANPGSFSVTASGTGGCSSNQVLPIGNSCLLGAQFSPATTGQFSATFTEATAPNSPSPSLQLSGTGAVLTPTNSVTAVTAGGPPQFGIAFTVTTTVTPSSCNTVAGYCVPTGTVSFSVDGNGVGTPVAVTSTGTASTPINGLSVGAHTVTTSYSGDLYYGPSSSTLNITVAQGTTTTTVSASPATPSQFSAITLIATVTTKTGAIATGTVSFFAPGSTTPLGTANVNPTTGIATLADTLVPATNTSPQYYNNYGLNAGTYAITAVYTSANTNYATSTSAPYSLVISADSAGFAIALSSTTVGTAQGSSSQVLATVIPTNTLSGTMKFSCTNMPANSDCTFQPTTLTFTPVPGVPTDQQVAITIFTDVSSAVIPKTSLIGWPILLGSFVSIFAFRRRLRDSRLFAMLALFGILAGGSVVLSGCSGGAIAITPTPVGSYTINFVATGPNGAVTTPITFTVGQGAPGQL